MQDNWSRENLGADAATLIEREWFTEARIEQYPLGLRPQTWLVIGGRGAGKTRLGAEWVNGLVRGFSPFAERSHGRIALIGETLGRSSGERGDDGLPLLAAEKAGRRGVRIHRP